MKEMVVTDTLPEVLRRPWVVAETGITTEGFNSEQEKWARDAVERLGFPVDNLKSLVYRPNPEGRENLAGSWTGWKGELALYKSLERFEPIAQLGTMAHELTHGSSPLEERNDEMWGGYQEREKAIRRAQVIADQTLNTEKYLNGYQKALCEAYQAGEIDEWRWVEETNAIMCELRFTNAKHLEQVEQAQMAVLAQNGRKGVSISEAADENLMQLLKKDSREELAIHVDGVRKWLDEQKGLGGKKELV